MQKTKRTLRKHIIKAYLTDEEYQQIIRSSELAGLSISTFVRNVCLGSKIASREDAMARRELLKVNADLGRLGGLLKQSITATGNREKIRPLLLDIEKIQTELKAKVRAI